MNARIKERQRVILSKVTNKVIEKCDNIEDKKRSCKSKLLSLKKKSIQLQEFGSFYKLSIFKKKLNLPLSRQLIFIIKCMNV